MTEKSPDDIAIGLRAIRFQIADWIEWSKRTRAREELTTEDGTHIMVLPVPVWPSHGQLGHWIKTIEAAEAVLSNVRE